MALKGKSSGISFGGYDPKTQVLIVNFRNGSYEYPGVPAHIAMGLRTAVSKGTYYNANIAGKYGR